jgi:glycosyltransferase involved in cell wall biosynthesis
MMESAHPSSAALAPPPSPAPHTVEIVIPVLDEERVLERSVRRLSRVLERDFPYPYRITVADNGSCDSTPAIARRLERELPHVRGLHVEGRGRGLALREAWSRSDAEVLCYMDVDLSTGLDALLPLVAPLVSGHSDLAIGSRLAPGARVERSLKRELISRGYNRLVRASFRGRFSDAQCGFKAGRADVIRALLPAVEDDGWFFDSELLVLAERSGLRIHEVPVDWVEDPDSRVSLMRTAVGDLRGIARVATRIARGSAAVELPAAARVPPHGNGAIGQLLRFAAIGVVSTGAYLVLYLLLGTSLPSMAANALALALSAIGNTAANRSITFDRGGRRHLLRHHVQGFAVFLLCLGLTSGALAVLGATAPGASKPIELVALCLANLLGTTLRFYLLRFWVFGPHPAIGPAGDRATPAVNAIALDRTAGA